MLRRWFTSTLVALALVGPVPASAQRLHGLLLDVGSDAPIPFGVVTLLSADGSPVGAVITDTSGRWEFRVPRAGQYLLAARRIGYQPWTAGPVDVAREDLEFRFHLQRAPVRLTPTVVTEQATRRQLQLSGFYDRQRADFGWFITPEEIEKRQAARLTDLLLGMPGVRLVSNSTGSAGGRSVQFGSGPLTDPGMCRPRVYVDGVIFTRGDGRPMSAPQDDQSRTTDQFIEEELLRVDQGLSLDDIGPPSVIAAIEVYRRGSQIPVQFGGNTVETSCGVIVVWTRRGAPVRGR